MRERVSRSPGVRPPVRRGGNAVLSTVCAGMVLAVAMALAAVRFAPEQSMREPSMRVAQPIDFDVLESGASLADLERGRSYYVQTLPPLSWRLRPGGRGMGVSDDAASRRSHRQRGQ